MNIAIFKRGATLIELIVVLAIVAILVGLSFPAVHYSREASRRALCASNLHQLGIAMTHFVEVRKKLPEVAPDGQVGGWAIALLPYSEEANLADGLSGNLLLAPAAPPLLARKRPAMMTCPSAYEGDSSLATVPPSHYSAELTRKGRWKLGWKFGELSIHSRLPWVTSPEVPFGGPASELPHGGGSNQIDGIGGKAYGVVYYAGD